MSRLGGKDQVWRSGVGRDGRRRSGLRGRQRAVHRRPGHVLARAGAVRGMELDINAASVNFTSLDLSNQWSRPRPPTVKRLTYDERRRRAATSSYCHATSSPCRTRPYQVPCRPTTRQLGSTRRGHGSPGEQGPAGPRRSGPWHDRSPRAAMRHELLRLQAELTTMTEWVKETGARVVVVFEGRDAAGKGGVIKRITEYLPAPGVPGRGPAGADRAGAVAVVLPALRGRTARRRRDRPVRPQLVQPGRRRAGDGLLHSDEYHRFLRQCPVFEHQLIEDGIILVKYWFSVSDEEQERRFQSRVDDPLRRWKLSADRPRGPTAVGRLLAGQGRHVPPHRHPGVALVRGGGRGQAARPAQLHRPPADPGALPATVDEARLKLPKRVKDDGYRRPPRDLYTYVPDYASTLVGS